MAPERKVRYADSGGLQIAYEATGSGPMDILVAFEWGANLDLMYELPEFQLLLRRFGEFGRVTEIRGVSGAFDDCEAPVR